MGATEAEWEWGAPDGSAGGPRAAGGVVGLSEHLRQMSAGPRGAAGGSVQGLQLSTGSELESLSGGAGCAGRRDRARPQGPGSRRRRVMAQDPAGRAAGRRAGGTGGDQGGTRVPKAEADAGHGAGRVPVLMVEPRLVAREDTPGEERDQTPDGVWVPVGAELGCGEGWPTTSGLAARPAAGPGTVGERGALTCSGLQGVGRALAQLAPRLEQGARGPTSASSAPRATAGWGVHPGLWGVKGRCRRAEPVTVGEEPGRGACPQGGSAKGRRQRRPGAQQVTRGGGPVRTGLQPCVPHRSRGRSPVMAESGGAGRGICRAAPRIICVTSLLPPCYCFLGDGGGSLRARAPHTEQPRQVGACPQPPGQRLRPEATALAMGSFLGAEITVGCVAVGTLA